MTEEVRDRSRGSSDEAPCSRHAGRSLACEPRSPDEERRRAEVAAAVARVVRPGVVVIATLAVVTIVVGCVLPGYDVHDARDRWIASEATFGWSMALVLAAVAAGGVAVWRDPRATNAALWMVLGWSLLCGPLLLMSGEHMKRYLDEAHLVERWPAELAVRSLLVVVVGLPVLSIVAIATRVVAHRRARRRSVPRARARRGGSKARSPIV